MMRDKIGYGYDLGYGCANEKCKRHSPLVSYECVQCEYRSIMRRSRRADVLSWSLKLFAMSFVGFVIAYYLVMR